MDETPFPRGAKPRLRAIPMRTLIPNAITMLALAAGATGVRFAISAEWEKAATAIVVAAVLDGIDGRVARLLRGTSRFGAELDSLSDVTAFGLAPAIILYLWALDDVGRFGWVIALALAVCCALRLARFNAALDSEETPRKRLGFLIGVPAPAGAGLALAPLFLDLALDGVLSADPQLRGILVAVTTLVVAGLMVSALPTWGAGSIRLPAAARVPALAAVGLMAAFLALAPWATLSVVACLYALSIPFALLGYRSRIAALETRG
ncbi:MAG: CDP-alcohol phosphatidyltransferase family protein [Sphingomonadaceae bacterium]